MNSGAAGSVLGAEGATLRFTEASLTLGQIGSTYRGAAYVYTKPAGIWVNTSSFTAKLTASDAANGDYMGTGVAIGGDGATVVAGASNNDAGGNSRGAAYVYTRSPGGWATTSSFSAKLTASDGADNDSLGEAVAISTDGSTIVAGSGFNAAGGSLRGAIYAYTKPQGGWTTTTQASKLVAADRVDGNLLGYEVAVNTDGATIIAGALGNSAGASGYGSAYVFGFGTPSHNADLSDLILSQGTLIPAFASAMTNYSAIVANSVSSITVTPTVSDTTAIVTVEGSPVASGSASSPLALIVGSNIITTTVTAQDGTTIKTYTITVTRALSNVYIPLILTP